MLRLVVLCTVLSMGAVWAQEQAQELLQGLRLAHDPKSAGAIVLNLIYSRQQVENRRYSQPGAHCSNEIDRNE